VKTAIARRLLEEAEYREMFAPLRPEFVQYRYRQHKAMRPLIVLYHTSDIVFWQKMVMLLIAIA
jgi:hypothetical protein